MKQAFSKMLPLAAILMAGVAMVACSVEKQPTETVEPSPKKMYHRRLLGGRSHPFAEY